MTRDTAVLIASLLLVGAGVALPLVGAAQPVAGDQAEGGAGGGGSGSFYGSPQGSIEFTCTEMRATVTPSYWDFYLRLYFRDTATGELIRGVAGPFSGTVTEPFDGELVLVYVEIDVNGAIIETGGISPDCYGVSGTDLDQSTNTRTKAMRTEAVRTNWMIEDARRPTVA